jgi:hypothetical protein
MMKTPLSPTQLRSAFDTAVQQPSNWFALFKRHGYGLRYAIGATLVMGMYLHITRLLIGQALLLMYVLTPAADMALAVPMTYGAIVSWLVWKRVQHPALWHRLVYGFLACYFTLSIPIHIRTYFTGSPDFVSAFPIWYSAAILPIMAGLLIFALRLRFKASAA